MSFERLVNEPLKLRASLTDGDGTKFVRAFLKDASGAPLSTPTVDLTHVGDGIYKDDDTVLMPNSTQVLVKYKVFDDAAYTILNDCGYKQPTFVYELSKFDPAITTPTNQLVKGRVETKSIKGKINGNQQILATVKTAAISAKLLSQQLVSGRVVQDQKIKGVVYE